MVQDILKNYNLPQTVKVIFKKNLEGVFYAKLPKYPGCMTLAHNEIELIENVTDAILTYFEVPRDVALKNKIVYFPIPFLKKLEELHSQSLVLSKPIKEEQSAFFLLYGAPNSYGKYTYIR